MDKILTDLLGQYKVIDRHLKPTKKLYKILYRTFDRGHIFLGCTTEKKSYYKRDYSLEQALKSFLSCFEDLGTKIDIIVDDIKVYQ